MALTLEYLRTVLNYDQESGVFVWLVTRNCKAVVGSPAGSVHVSSGYMRIAVDQVQYKAHRLAWFYMHGTWPAEIDHIDGNRLNNRLANLRAASKALNAQNRRRALSTSHTGVLGVHLDPISRRYRARIYHAGRVHRLGFFKTADEASLAYVAAKRRLHEGCTL